jgi:hypothetical protein
VLLRCVLTLRDVVISERRSSRVISNETLMGGHVRDVPHVVMSLFLWSSSIRLFKGPRGLVLMKEIPMGPLRWVKRAKIGLARFVRGRFLVH